MYGLSRGTEGREREEIGERRIWRTLNEGKRVEEEWSGIYASEGNALFSPPTGPRGFLGYPSVVHIAPVYAIVRCVLPGVHIRGRPTSFVHACVHVRARVYTCVRRKVGTVRAMHVRSTLFVSTRDRMSRLAF